MESRDNGFYAITIAIFSILASAVLTLNLKVIYENRLLREDINNNDLFITNTKEIEDKIDRLSKKMADNHIKRLNEGKCSASVGAQYLKLSSDVERIGDHLININDKDYEISHWKDK